MKQKTVPLVRTTTCKSPQHIIKTLLIAHPTLSFLFCVFLRVTIRGTVRGLTAECCIPPHRYLDAKRLAGVCVGLQALAQGLAVQPQLTQVVKAGVKVTAGAQHSVAHLKRAAGVREEPAEVAAGNDLLVRFIAGWGGEWSG